MGEKEEELRITNWQLQNNHRDIKYSIEDMVNNIYGVRWVLDLSG